MKRFLWLVSIILLMCLPVSADFIKWVDFDVPYESLQYAMNVDIDSFEEEQHISWIDILSLAACRTGGKCGLTSVKRAARELKQEKVPQIYWGKPQILFLLSRGIQCRPGRPVGKLCHLPEWDMGSKVRPQSLFSHC